MSLEYAVDRLYESGWTPTSGRIFKRLDDGRQYPSPDDVALEFTAAGLQLTLRHVTLFNSFRAEWVGRTERFSGYCVGETEQEAAVYALAQLIRLPTLTTIHATDAATALGF